MTRRARLLRCIAAVFYEASELDACLTQCRRAIKLATDGLELETDKAELKILRHTIGKSHECLAEALHVQEDYTSAAEHFTKAAEYVNSTLNLKSASSSQRMVRTGISTGKLLSKSDDGTKRRGALPKPYNRHEEARMFVSDPVSDPAVQDDETASQSSQGVAAETDTDDDTEQDLFTEPKEEEAAGIWSKTVEPADSKDSKSGTDSSPSSLDIERPHEAAQSVADQQGSAEECKAPSPAEIDSPDRLDLKAEQSAATDTTGQSEPDHTKFPPALKALQGVVVLLSDLSKECYNGATAKVVGYNESNGRFVMLLMDTENANKKIQVKPSNIKFTHCPTPVIPTNYNPFRRKPKSDRAIEEESGKEASEDALVSTSENVSENPFHSYEAAEYLAETLKANNLDPDRVEKLFDKLHGLLGDTPGDVTPANRIKIEKILEKEPLTLDRSLPPNLAPFAAFAKQQQQQRQRQRQLLEPKIEELDGEEAVVIGVDRQVVNRSPPSADTMALVDQFDVGDRIRLHGLGKAYYNGLEGSVIEVKKSTGRVGVRISSTKAALDEATKVEVFGKELSVKPDNLEKLMPRVITPNYKPEPEVRVEQSHIVPGQREGLNPLSPTPSFCDASSNVRAPRIKTPFGYLEAVVGPSGAAALAASGGGGMNGDVTLDDLDGSLRIDDIARGKSGATQNSEASFEDLLQQFKDEDEARKNKKSGSDKPNQGAKSLSDESSGTKKKKKRKKKKAASLAVPDLSVAVDEFRDGAGETSTASPKSSPKSVTLNGIRQREIKARRDTMDAREKDHLLNLQDVADYEVFVQGPPPLTHDGCLFNPVLWVVLFPSEFFHTNIVKMLEILEMLFKLIRLCFTNVVQA